MRILQNRPSLTAIKSLYHEYGTLPISMNCMNISCCHLFRRLYVVENTCLICFKTILIKTLCCIHIMHVRSLIYTYIERIPLLIRDAWNIKRWCFGIVYLIILKYLIHWLKWKPKWRLIFHYVEFNLLNLCTHNKCIWHQCVISSPVISTLHSALHM